MSIINIERKNNSKLKYSHYRGFSVTIVRKSVSIESFPFYGCCHSCFSVVTVLMDIFVFVCIKIKLLEIHMSIKNQSICLNICVCVCGGVCVCVCV